MRLIITRPEEDAAPLAARLAAMGHEAIVAPLLRIVPRKDVAIPQRDYRAVIATSANGIRMSHDERLKQIPILTVGPQSLAAAQEFGFIQAQSAGGDALGLARHIQSAMRPQDGPLLYLSGAATAGDLEGHLGRAGFDIDRVILYDAVAAETLDVDLAACDGVLLYSPRTARVWASLAGSDARHLVHFCLSANVAEALPASYPIAIAQRPEESAMMALLSGR